MSIDTNIFNNLLVNIAHKIVKPMFNQSLLGFEFDDNKDFDHFFLKVRTDTLELLKHLTVLDQNLCLVFVGQSIEKSLNESNSDPKNWEILAQLSAAVFNKISDKRQFCIESETLLKSLIDKCNKDNPNVISSQLSCISALTVFLPNISNHLLNQIIERTLLLATFTLTNETIKSKEVKDLRRHSCSLFIKICQTYPTLLVPLFTTIRQYIGLNNENFSQMEKCSLNEGLLLISNEFENIEHQKLFAKELIDTIVWINSYKPNPNDFICDIGLNVDSIDDVVLSQRRANLSYVVNLTLSFLKRIKTERSVVFIPNIFPVIDGLFNLISNLNTIWRSEYQQKCCVNYKNMVYADISETDKKNILDQPLSDVSEMLTKSAAYRMQIFVWNLHENCYATLGVATSVLQPHFYDQICDFKLIFTDIEFLPQWKLRMIARSFVRPFITNCPQNQIMFNKIESILSLLLQYLFNNLNVKWDEIKARNQLSETDDMKDKSDPIETEVISDEINRLLSREFIDIMVAILTPSKVTQSCDTSDMNSNSFDTKISDLGNYLLNVIPNVIIYPIAKTLSWIDTNIALKTAQLNQLLIQKIISDNMIKSENAVYFLFEQLISGLSYFGEHEQNQSILLQLVLTLYEGIAIKMGFDSIKQQLSQITGSSLKDWIDFDQKLHKTCEPNTKYVLTDKKKKEIIKKLLSQVIGKNIGQLYKYQSVEIKNLKPIFYTKNNRQNTLDDDISLCLLFSD